MGHTDIKGGVVAALDDDAQDSGKLSLNTGSLSVSDIKDSATSRDISVGVSANINDPFEQGVKGANTPVVDASYASSDFRQDTKGTIGQGNVTVTPMDAYNEQLCTQTAVAFAEDLLSYINRAS